MRNHANTRGPIAAAALALTLLGGLAAAAAPAASAWADEQPAPDTTAPLVEVQAPAEPLAELAEPEVDPNPPIVRNTTPVDGAVYPAGTQITVAFECFDPDDPITYCGQYSHEAGDVVTLEPGDYHWRFYANNARVNVVHNVFFKVLPYDTTPPTVTIDQPAVPASGWYTGDTYVGFIGHDGSGVVKHVVLEFADGTIQRSEGPLLGHWFTEGVTDVIVYAIDGSNNAGVGQPLTLKVDTSAPAISVSSEAGPFEVGQQVDFDFDCTDALSGVTDCSSNAVLRGELDTSAPGDYAIELTATDVAGNTATTTFVYTVLTPDTEAPRISFDIQAPNAAGWFNAPVDALLSAQDGAGRGVKAIDWAIDGPEARSGSSALQESLRFSADGEHTLSAVATDLVGNESGTEEFVVRIDATAPLLDTATKLTFVQGGRVDFSSLCSDGTSGVVDCGIVELPPLAAEAGPTDELGAHTVLLGATDAAGNSARAQVTYEVIAAPAAEQPRPTQPLPTLAFTGTGAPAAGLLWAALLILSGAAAVIATRRARA